MGIADKLQDAPDVLDEMFRATHRHADQLVQLRETDDHGGGVGETDDDRMRQKIHDDAELEGTQRQLNDSDQQGQHDGQGNEGFRAGRCQRRQGRCGQQRCHRHRPRAELVRGTPQRGYHHRQECGIESVIGGHAGQLRISHRLRYQHQGDGKAGNEVGAQQAARIGKPAQERQGALQQGRNAQLRIFFLSGSGQHPFLQCS